MTQPQRPISRSSTPIEFTPLILDLEPEVKEEPKKKRGGTVLTNDSSRNRDSAWSA